MSRFHVALHPPLPSATARGPLFTHSGRSKQTLEISAARQPRAFSLSFEEAAERLQQFDRLFFEPDGSFVWTSARGGPPWQVDGVLTDHAGHVRHLELKGTCPFEQFRELCGLLREDDTSLTVQLIEQAVFLTEEDFCSLFWDGPPAE